MTRLLAHDHDAHTHAMTPASLLVTPAHTP